MPGDGIGNDVMDAAKIVLDKLALDAEYVHADIGWEFWINEGNPLPERTAELRAVLHGFYRDAGARFLRAKDGVEPWRPF